LDLVLENGEGFSCSFRTGSWAVLPFQLPAQAAIWRKIGPPDGPPAFAVITDNGKLIVDKAKKKLGCSPADILAFEVVNGQGCPTPEGNLVVIVVKKKVEIYELGKLKDVANKKLNDAIAATITDRGFLIVQTSTRLEVIPLPSFKGDGAAKFPLPNGAFTAVIPGSGAVVNDQGKVTFYTHAYDDAPIYDARREALVEPPMCVKALFGTSELPKPSVEEVDSSFAYVRSGKALSNTANELQAILVTSRVRTSKLKDVASASELLRRRSQGFAERGKVQIKPP
jgi:hypothetical protein